MERPSTALQPNVDERACECSASPMRIGRATQRVCARASAHFASETPGFPGFRLKTASFEFVKICLHALQCAHGRSPV